MEFDYNKLKGRIIEKFGSISEFCKALNTSSTAISLKLNNKAGISRSDIIKWSKLLDISPEQYGVFYFTEKLNKPLKKE